MCNLASICFPTKAFYRCLTNILNQNKRKCIPLYTLVDKFTWLGFYFHQFFLIMNLFVPMFKHIFVKLVCFSKSVFQVWFFRICFKPQIVLHFTSCWFYQRYLYDSSQVRQTTPAVFRISQHILLKEFFISTTAFLPASQSVYLLYKKQASLFQCPYCPQLPVGLLPGGNRRGPPVYLREIKQQPTSLIGHGDKAPPSASVVIQHLTDFACA